MTHGTMHSDCNACSQVTEHTIVHMRTYRVIGTDGSKDETRSYTVHCLGCQEGSIRMESWHCAADGTEKLIKVDFQPPRLWRREPTWLEELEDREPDLKDLLVEVYSAVSDPQTRLLSMGVRAALDYVMNVILGGDAGTFEKKLDMMVDQGHLTKRQRDNLETVIDAASATSHRGYRPPRHLVEEMVVVMEGLIREHFVTNPMLAHMKLLIPPRPPRLGQAAAATSPQQAAPATPGNMPSPSSAAVAASPVATSAPASPPNNGGGDAGPAQA